MKKLFSTLFVVFFATSLMAQSGLSCEDPIPIDKDYRATVDGAGEVWYTATTYDLPLHVYFSPVSDNSTWGPEVEVDFTCTYGVYDDPKLDSLVNLAEDFNITFPIELLCEPVVRNGKTEWDLSVSKSYRDQLADFGVTYPVQAFVKVRYSEGGTVSLTPDTAFTSCMDNAHYVVLGDTIDILANDAERVFVFPYTEWQEDSIRFVWTGAESAQVYVAVQECTFSPSENDPYVWDNFSVSADVPHKLYSEGMKAAIKEQKEGGIYYGKVVAPTAGQLVVEKIPRGAAQGGALLLEHGSEVQLEEALYCIPKILTSSQLVFSNNKSITMYVSNTTDFEALSEDKNVLATFVSNIENEQNVIYISSQEIANFSEEATDDYLYIRFTSQPTATTLQLNAWDASECADKSILLRPDVKQFLPAKSSLVVYRARYADYAGRNLTIKWESSNRLPVYIAKTCDFTLSLNNAALLLKPAPTIARNSELLVEAAEIDSWATQIDDNGYFYVRFNPTNPGEVTFIPEKSAAPDPVYTEFSVSICHDEAYTWNEITYEKTGSYTQEFVAVNGADSIVTLHLTVFPETPATTEEVTIDFATTYEWHGTVYSESGEYSITLQDENGCDYQATLFLTVLPEPLSPCVAASIELLANDQITLNLHEAVTIYRINYEAWVEKGVELVWSGTTALHTFVAEGCEFLLSETNKHVLRYEHLLSDGAVVIDAAFLSSVAHKVDEDGFLYIRFLSVEEGTLTTIQPE